MKLETFCRNKPPEKANQQTHQFAEQGPSPDSGVPAGQPGWGGGGQGRVPYGTLLEPSLTVRLMPDAAETFTH